MSVCRRLFRLAWQVPQEGMELLAGARFVGRDHTFFEFGKCQSAHCVVVLQLRFDLVAFGVRGS